MRRLAILLAVLIAASVSAFAANFCSGFDGVPTTTVCTTDANCSVAGGYCGFEITILVPVTALGDLANSKAAVVSTGAVKANTTNAEFAVFLIRRGLGQDILAQAETDGDTARQIAIDTTINTAKTNFPTPLRPAVCGDGEVDSPREQCDDGGSNSDSTPDACRTACVDAFCGDGVVDTGETCDGVGCLPDCSGTTP